MAIVGMPGALDPLEHLRDAALRIALGIVLPLAHLAQVHARAERGPLAAHHHHAHVGILVERVHVLDEPGQHRAVHRVAPVRPVHGEGGDTRFDLQYELVGHATPFDCWSWGERGPLLPQTPPPRVMRCPIHRSSCRAITMRCTSDGPFADAADTGFAVPALQRELLGDAVAPVDLDGGVDDAAEHLARVELGDRGLHARVLAAIRLPGARPDDPAAGAQLHLGVGEHPLNGLALGQRLAERRALLGMRDGHAMRRHRHPEIAGRVGETVLHEEVEGQVEALPLRAHERVARQHAVLEHHVVGPGGGADHLDLARVEARGAVLQDEAGDARARPCPCRCARTPRPTARRARAR